MTASRVRLIELLTFPRMLALEAIDAKDCPHDIRYQSGESECAECGHGELCEWLTAQEPFAELTAKPERRLAESLRYAVDYVKARNHRAGPSARACTCASCQWLRDARQVLREIEGWAIAPGFAR